MALPIPAPLEPMLAKAVPEVPVAAEGSPGLLYEPKWDGFRCVVFRDGDSLELGSRGSKPLTRYFPDLVEQLAAQLPQRCVVDGEVVVRTGSPGAERLDWEALSQRIHPAASRVRQLAEATPASFVAFDLLALGDDDLRAEPFARRRELLEQVLAGARPPVHLTRTTRDPEVARRWFSEFEGAGLDGVVAKPLDAVYAPGQRVMLKVKHHRTADVVVVGYRVHKSGSGVGSLLLGLHDADGQLRQVGGASAFTARARLELEAELAPLVVRDEAGEVVRGRGEPNRFNARQDHSWVVLEPELVAEVRYDQMEGERFRHVAHLLRWRPDREPASCTFAQLDLPLAYDLDAVLSSAHAPPASVRP